MCLDNPDSNHDHDRNGKRKPMNFKKKPRRKNKVDENGKPRQKRSDAGKPRGKRHFKKKEVNDEGTNDNDNTDETTEISVVDEDITVESSDSSET